MTTDWIAVKDSLPELYEFWKGSKIKRSDDVLIAKFDDEGCRYFQVARLRQGGGGDLENVYWDTPEMHEDEITHWMPLPDAP